VGAGRFLVVGSSHYSDGDTVEVLLQVADDEVIVSDGDEALARLELGGVNVESGRARQMWSALIRAHVCRPPRQVVAEGHHSRDGGAYRRHGLRACQH
jgi:hypothetical protein